MSTQTFRLPVRNPGGLTIRRAPYQ